MICDGFCGAPPGGHGRCCAASGHGSAGGAGQGPHDRTELIGRNAPVTVVGAVIAGNGIFLLCLPARCPRADGDASGRARWPPHRVVLGLKLGRAEGHCAAATHSAVPRSSKTLPEGQNDAYRSQKTVRWMVIWGMSGGNSGLPEILPTKVNKALPRLTIPEGDRQHALHRTNPETS
jgi:hypothetical protein